MIGSATLIPVARNPLSGAAAFLSLAFSAGYLIWFGGDMLTLTVAVLMAAILLAAWVFLLSRSPVFQIDRSVGEAARALGDMEALAAELQRLGAEKGVMQLQKLQSKYDNLVKILRQRMNQGELTYGRYVSVAHQVLLSGIDSLREVSLTLQASSQIDTKQAAAQLKELTTARSKAEGSDEEIKALSDRLALADEQKNRLGALYARNESALTVLDQAATALASTKTKQGEAGTDISSAIQAMEELASRTREYAAR